MRNRGLTTVEISVVMIVMVLLAGTAAPRLSSAVATAQSAAAARQVATAFRYARQAALSWNKNLRLRFDGSTLRLYDGGRVVQRFPIPGGVDVEVRPTPVAFHPRGTCTSAVAVIRSGTSTIRVTLNTVGLVDVGTENVGTGKDRR